mmetsp:Transcript_2346/g.3250  ORF Transcript_2346/g.3250 Transcript_2346/m.3250 type:complete len:226 (+) Transcript_2346:77-754(+)
MAPHEVYVAMSVLSLGIVMIWMSTFNTDVHRSPILGGPAVQIAHRFQTIQGLPKCMPAAGLRHVRSVPSVVSGYRQQRRQREVSAHGTSRDNMVDHVRQLTVREIKNELTEKGVSTAGIFEKQDLVNLLVDARIDSGEISPLDTQLRQARDIIDKASTDVKAKAGKAVSAMKNFDIKSEMKKQVDTIKDGIKENVDWYGEGEKNPFAEGRVVRKQRGYYKGGDDL